MKNAAKTYISDTFHKNDEFYEYSTPKKEDSVPVEKVVQGDLHAYENSEHIVLSSKQEGSLEQSHDQPKDKRGIENPVSPPNIGHNENEPVKITDTTRELPEKLDLSDSLSQSVEQENIQDLVAATSALKPETQKSPSVEEFMREAVNYYQNIARDELIADLQKEYLEKLNIKNSVQQSTEHTPDPLPQSLDQGKIKDFAVGIKETNGIDTSHEEEKQADHWTVVLDKMMERRKADRLFQATGKTAEEIEKLQNPYRENHGEKEISSQNKAGTNFENSISFSDEVSRQLHFIKYHSPMPGTNKSDVSLVIFERKPNTYPINAKAEIFAGHIIDRFREYQKNEIRGKVSDEAREDFKNALKEVFKNDKAMFYIQMKDQEAYKAMDEFKDNVGFSKSISFSDEVTRQLYFIKYHSPMPGTNKSDASLVIFEKELSLHRMKTKAEIFAEHVIDRFREYQKNDNKGKISDETREDFKNGLKEIFKNDNALLYIRTKDLEAYKAMDELSKEERQRTTQKQHQRGFEIDF